VPGEGGDVPSGLRPGWADDARHPQYPERAWLTAVGVADLAESASDARRLADERARQEIVFSLRARVQSFVEVRSRSTLDSAEVDVDELTRVVGAATLEGAKIATRSEDRGRGVIYSLAVVNRAVAARNLEADIDETLAEANRVLVEAGRRVSRGRRVEQLLASYRLFRESRLTRSTFRVLTGRDYKKVEDRGNEVRGRLEALFADMRLEVTSGDGQDASPGAPFPEEVVVRAVLVDGAKREPVPGIDLTIAPEVEGAVELSIERGRTGVDGSLRFRVPLVRASGEGIGRIRVALDVAATGLDGPSVDVEYSLPTRETLDVLILLEEINMGRKVTPSSTATALGDHLKRAGFPIVDALPLIRQHGERTLSRADRRELRRLLGTKVDVVIRGKVEATGGGTVLGGLASARARATLNGLDLRSGRVLAALQVGPKVEAHQRADEAGRRSLRLLRPSIQTGIRERLESVLAGGE